MGYDWFEGVGDVDGNDDANGEGNGDGNENSDNNGNCNGNGNDDINVNFVFDDCKGNEDDINEDVSEEG